MKLPKTIKVSSKTYTVIKDRKASNARGRTFLQTITIGTHDQSDERVFDGFLHEIAELVCCENNFRYGDGHSETSVFVMNHKEFERFISDVASAIYPMVKK